MGLSSHGSAHRLGALGSASLDLTLVQGQDGGGVSQLIMYTLDGTEDEDEALEGEEDDDDDETDDSGEYDLDDDDEDEEGLHGAEYHGCPIHDPQWPPDQPSYYQDLDAYLSDDLDQPEDTAAPLIDYVVSHLVADDVDMDGPAEYDSDVGFTWTEGAGSSLEFAVETEPDIAASDPAAAMMAHAHAHMAAYASMPPLPAMDLDPGAAWTHIYQFSVSNPNPTTIGPSNYGLTDFLRHWARQSRILQGMARGSCPWPAKVNALETSQIASIEYEDLQGDECDFQGVDWDEIGVTRRDARERRLLTYSNYVNIPGSDRWTVSVTLTYHGDAIAYAPRLAEPS